MRTQLRTILPNMGGQQPGQVTQRLPSRIDLCGATDAKLHARSAKAGDVMSILVGIPCGGEDGGTTEEE